MHSRRSSAQLDKERENPSAVDGGPEIGSHLVSIHRPKVGPLHHGDLAVEQLEAFRVTALELRELGKDQGPHCESGSLTSFSDTFPIPTNVAALQSLLWHCALDLEAVLETGGRSHKCVHHLHMSIHLRSQSLRDGRIALVKRKSTGLLHVACLLDSSNTFREENLIQVICCEDPLLPPSSLVSLIVRRPGAACRF